MDIREKTVPLTEWYIKTGAQEGCLIHKQKHEVISKVLTMTNILVKLIKVLII